MANFHLRGALELAEKLSQLAESTDEIAFAMVDEATDVMDKELREAILVNTQKYGTGVLAESIHHNKPERIGEGFYATSTARGTDTKKGKYKKTSHKAYSKSGKYVGYRKSYGKGAVRNQDKLYYHEYGNSRQSARPIIKPCVDAAEPKVMDKMQEVFDRMTGGK